MKYKMKDESGSELKAVPSGEKYNGLRGLPTEARNNMGYAKLGTETSFLSKMTMGGSADMIGMLKQKGYGDSMMDEKKIGGSTYSNE